MDFNGDGYVTRADFAQMSAMQGQGYYGQAVAQQAFTNMDRNRDGMLDGRDNAYAYGGHYGGNYYNQGYGYGHHHHHHHHY